MDNTELRDKFEERITELRKRLLDNLSIGEKKLIQEEIKWLEYTKPPRGKIGQMGAHRDRKRPSC